MTPDRLEQIAHLLAGVEPGWQTRFAGALGISRSHASNMLSGARPLTADALDKLRDACIRAAGKHMDRAQALTKVALKLVTPPPIDDPPPPAPGDYIGNFLAALAKDGDDQ